MSQIIKHSYNADYDDTDGATYFRVGRPPNEATMVVHCGVTRTILTREVETVYVSVKCPLPHKTDVIYRGLGRVDITVTVES